MTAIGGWWDPGRGADRRHRCRGDRLPGGDRPERLLLLRHHQHSGAPTSSFLMNSAISRSPRPARYLTVLSWLEGFRFWGGTMAALAFVFSLFFRSDGRASLIGGFVSLLACFLLFNVMAKDHPNRYPEGLSTGHPVTSYPVDIAGPITPRLRKFRLCKGRA